MKIKYAPYYLVIILCIVAQVLIACLPDNAFAPTPTKISSPSTASVLSYTPQEFQGELNNPSFEVLSTRTPGPDDLIQTVWIYGSWNCRIQPSAFSDNIINLHDGELVVLKDIEGNWLLIQAGKKVCWVRSDAIKEK